MENPYEELLDRESYKIDLHENFSEIIATIQDIVNYGTNLIIRCFGTGKRDISDAIILGVLLRQAVSMLDALEVLISNGSVYPANLQCRALFEVALYLEWVLEKNSAERAKFFYVSNIRKKRIWALRTQSGTPENSALEKIMAPIGGVSETTKKIETESKKQLQAIDKLLQNPEFASINQSIDNFKAKRKIKYEPSWYSPLGVENVRQLAISLNRLHEYELIYSSSSEVMHSSKQDEHIKFGGDYMSFQPIRSLSGISEILNFSVSTILRIYIQILEKYRQGEMKAFGKKYVENWQQPFLSIKSVEYKKSKPTKII